MLAAITNPASATIMAMVVLSAALLRTGALEAATERPGRLADRRSVLDGASPPLALALLYAFTLILAAFVTNQAVGMLMTPIAASVAVDIMLDPRPFGVAVIIAASAAFATSPYDQTNTPVDNARGCRFGDFVRVGLPLNILMGMTAVLVIPISWPLAIK